MSELSKYQRSKQRVLEMIEQLKQNSWLANLRGNRTQAANIEKDLEELSKAVTVIDHRMNELQREDQQKAA